MMPQMGESIAEGTLVRWLKSVGDKVDRDEPLFEISTDKVDTEIPSPSDGILTEIKVQEGETVSVQTVVALLSGEDVGSAPASAPAAESAPPPAPAPPAPAPAPQASAPPAAPAPQPVSTAIETVEPPVAAAAVTSLSAEPIPIPEPVAAALEAKRTSPLVRKIAREHGIDLNRVPGSGSGGRVTKNDILSFIENGGAQAAPQAKVAPAAPASQAAPVAAGSFTAPNHGFSPEEVDVQPLSNMRLKIAEHMVMSKSVSPHVTTHHEVDMTLVAQKIKQHKERFLKINGAKLTFLPFIIKAVVSGLREFPILNSCMVGKDVHYFKKVNIGIAVAVPDGLLVPVIRDADEKSIVGQARAITDLATRARSKKIGLDDLKGGTFTLSNYGVNGCVLATPVINQPQAAVLGLGAVVKRPVVLPDSDAIAVRSMSYFSLSFDHRIIDGAVADQFMSHVRGILEACPYDPMES